MSTANATMATLPSGVRERQLAAIFAFELKKAFLSTRALGLYVVALLPVLLFILAIGVNRKPFDLAWIPNSFAYIFQLFILRMATFFGCAAIFTNLIRAEFLDRSLHYYFLVPVRRELIAIGKYLAGVVGTACVFGLSTILTLVAMHLGHSPQLITHQMLTGPGLDSLLAYLATTTLACVGYGAVFLVMGLLFKNPLIPALVVWGWEALTYLLPAVLKKLTIIHYLDSLAPIPIDEGTFALIADPVSPPVAVVGVLIVSGLLLAFAARKLRTTEVSYGLD